MQALQQRYASSATLSSTWRSVVPLTQRFCRFCMLTSSWQLQAGCYLAMVAAAKYCGQSSEAS